MLQEERAQVDEGSNPEVLRRGLRTLAYELTLAEARERERIARDLHDEIGQTLAVAHFSLESLKRCAPAEREARFDELSGLLAQASRATRSATFELSSPALKLGLEEALVELVSRLQRAGGPVFRIDGHLPPGEWAEPVLWVLYRVLRELAVNVQRHAHAQQAWVHIGGDAQCLVISFTDDGVGIDTEAGATREPSREGGFGLVSAKAQMQALGGTLALESGAGAGTRATLRLPLPVPF